MLPSPSGLPLTYTYSVVHGPHQYEVVVYVKPKDSLKPAQTEIGRTLISEDDVAEAQKYSQYTNTVQLHVHNIIQTYESSLQEKEDYKDFVSKQSLQETTAELVGYLGALGYNVGDVIPDLPYVDHIVQKAAELKKAQLENKPNAKFLAAELDALKQSFQASALVYKQAQIKSKIKPIAYFDPIVIKSQKSVMAAYAEDQVAAYDAYALDDYDNDDDDWNYEPPSQLKKKQKAKTSQVSLAFVDSVRKFRND